MPVIGVTAAWIQLGEQPNAIEGAGMMLIIAALAVLAAYGIAAGRRVPRVSADDVIMPPVIE